MIKQYRFIYCHYGNFTQKDLEKFPVLKLKNVKLRYIFSLDYKDLFSLTLDKRYYIFNIVIANIYPGDNNQNEGHWVFGLPFLKKYQFSFDIDNKLIYFYNKEKNFEKSKLNTDNLEEEEQSINKINDISNDISENYGNDTEITKGHTATKKITNKIKYIDITFEKILIFFFFSFYFHFSTSFYIITNKKNFI